MLGFVKNFMSVAQAQNFLGVWPLSADQQRPHLGVKTYNKDEP